MLAIDNSTNTKWSDQAGVDASLIITCSTSKVVTKFRFATANDVSQSPPHAPGFTFENFLFTDDR